MRVKTKNALPYLESAFWVMCSVSVASVLAHWLHPTTVSNELQLILFFSTATLAAITAKYTHEKFHT